MEKKPLKPRALAKQETREALIRAGTAEFAEKGLAGPSLDDICARAGLTRGAFYVHFRDRDELLVAVVDRVLQGFQNAVIASEGASGDLAATVNRYVTSVASGVSITSGTAKWQFHDTLVACSRVPALRDRYAALQRRAIEGVAKAARGGQREKAVRDDVSAESIGELLVVLSLGVSAMIDLGEPFDSRGKGRGINLARSAAALVKLLAPRVGAGRPVKRAVAKRKAR